MEVTPGIETKGGSMIMHVLKLIKNLYGHRQVYHVWNQHLTKVLEEIGFR